MNAHRKLLSFFALMLLIAAPRNAQAQNRTGTQRAGDDSAYDKIVQDFIRFDIGQVTNPIAVEQIKARFYGLRADDSVPALVRGLNASNRMRASCPITAIANKLRAIVSASKNPQVGTYVLENLDRNAGPYGAYVSAVHDVARVQVTRHMEKGLAEEQFKRRAEDDLQRLAYSPGLKITDLPPRDPSQSEDAAHRDRPVAAKSAKSVTGHPAAPEPDSAATAIDWSKFGADELRDRLADKASQAKALAELSRRAGAGQEKAVEASIDAILKCMVIGDDIVRESAARLVGTVRCQSAVPQLIDLLEDPNAHVRSAAATALSRTTRQLFGPSDDANAEERRVAVARWREWWGRQGKTVERAADSAAR